MPLLRNQVLAIEDTRRIPKIAIIWNHEFYVELFPKKIWTIIILTLNAKASGVQITTKSAVLLDVGR
jgi:hypothetical protein